MKDIRLRENSLVLRLKSELFDLRAAKPNSVLFGGEGDDSAGNPRYFMCTHPMSIRRE